MSLRYSYQRESKHIYLAKHSSSWLWPALRGVYPSQARLAFFAVMSEWTTAAVTTAASNLWLTSIMLTFRYQMAPPHTTRPNGHYFTMQEKQEGVNLWQPESYGWNDRSTWGEILYHATGNAARVWAEGMGCKVPTWQHRPGSVHYGRG